MEQFILVFTVCKKVPIMGLPADKGLKVVDFLFVLSIINWIRISVLAHNVFNLTLVLLNLDIQKKPADQDLHCFSTQPHSESKY